jgi:hypothetical protein
MASSDKLRRVALVVTSQKTPFFIVTVVKTSNLTGFSSSSLSFGCHWFADDFDLCVTIAQYLWAHRNYIYVYICIHIYMCVCVCVKPQLGFNPVAVVQQYNRKVIHYRQTKHKHNTKTQK